MGKYFGCESFRRLTRRGVVQAGAVSALGLGLDDLLRLREAQAGTVKTAAKADSVLMLWLSGGPPHQDLWDMKPEASAEIRGEFKPIESSLYGLQISELLPRTARRMHQLAMLRGIHHDRGEHEGAHVWTLTGYKPTRPFFALRDPSQDQPSLGSVITHELGPKNALPPYISIPQAHYNGGFNAFLPRTCFLSKSGAIRIATSSPSATWASSPACLTTATGVDARCSGRSTIRSSSTTPSSRTWPRKTITTRAPMTWWPPRSCAAAYRARGTVRHGRYHLLGHVLGHALR